MGNLRFRVPLDNSHAPRGANKVKYLLFLVVVCLIAVTFIPDISFAKSSKWLKREVQEMERFKKFEGIVKRKGDTLLLKSNSGTDISLKNSPGCENYETCISFIFFDYFKDVGFFLVKSYYWEGTEHIMISESDGKEYYIHELPMFSPDKRYIVTVPDDVDTGYDENGVFIWRIEGKEIISEFSYVPMEYATYEFVRWKDNNYIELKKWLRSSKELCPETDFMIIPISLEKEADGWKLYKYLSLDSVQCDAN